MDGFAGGDNFVDTEPFGNYLAAGVTEDSTLKAGLGGDEEGGALGGEGVGFPGVFGEEVQATSGTVIGPLSRTSKTRWRMAASSTRVGT